MQVIVYYLYFPYQPRCSVFFFPNAVSTLRVPQVAIMIRATAVLSFWRIRLVFLLIRTTIFSAANKKGRAHS